MADLSKTVIDFVMCEEACAAGIATVETLAGGPPSADLTYVLPGAKSAVSFAVALDQSMIPPYLSKKDHRSHQHNNVRTNNVASGLALNLARYLDQTGYPSYPLASNNVYRKDAPRGILDLIPDISLRYLAVASGIGSFGLSGNVLRKEEGAAIILGGVVTTAELEPTDPLPEEENYCDGCRLCMASCASGLMDPEDAVGITLGDKEFTYSTRRTYHRCELVCGGFTGLHPSGKWSTWSPGRFNIPEKDEEFMPALIHGVQAYLQRPAIGGGFYPPALGNRISFTCGNCQLICAPDKDEREERYKMLTESGCVVQSPDGSLEAFSPEEAAKRAAGMGPETRALYEEV